MIIIYLHQYFNTPDMPGGTRSYEMARRLVKAGHNVHVITSRRDQNITKGWSESNEEGIRVYWFSLPYSNEMKFSQRIWTFLKFALASARKGSSIDADVVFSTSTPLTIALPGVFISKKTHIPMVFEVRDLWPELPIAIGALRSPVLKYLAEKLELFAYKNSRRIVALSPGMAKGVESKGYPPKLISIIPNSCDLELFAPNLDKAKEFRKDHPELEDGPIVLYPGTLGKINGVAYLAKLASKMLLRRPDCRFVVIGYGMEWHLIKRFASDLAVLNINFFMYKPIPKKKLVDAFCAASVITSLFLDLPEMEANSANKFFDGLASGTPVAINYGGWQAELIRKHKTGLCLSRDPIAAAQKLAGFLSDEQLMQENGKNARNLAASRFDRNILAEKLEKVLLDSINGEPYNNI